MRCSLCSGFMLSSLSVIHVVASCLLLVLPSCVEMCQCFLFVVVLLVLVIIWRCHCVSPVVSVMVCCWLLCLSVCWGMMGCSRVTIGSVVYLHLAIYRYIPQSCQVVDNKGSPGEVCPQQIHADTCSFNLGMIGVGK